MLNYIWMGLVLAAVFVGGLMGRLQGDDGVVSSAFSMAKFAVVNLAIPLGAMMILWLGIMRLAEASGIVNVLARLIRPVMRRLFPEVPSDHPAVGAMVMNMAANMLGLGNAATPLGLRAMGHLQELNKKKDTASDAMCTFLAINTSSVTLIPATAIALLAGAGIAAPYTIVGPAIAATACSTVVAIMAAKLFAKMRFFRITEGGGTRDKKAGEEESGEIVLKPVTPGRAIWLVLLGLGLLAVFVLELVPGLRENLKDTVGLSAIEHAAEASKAAAREVEEGVVAESGRLDWRRFVSAVSVTSIPFIFVLFLGYAAARGVKVYEVFIEGAKEGFAVALRVMPYMVAMLVALGMFRASGALMLMQWVIAPVLDVIGFPPDLLPMALMRPLSGSGAQGVLGEILANDQLSETLKYTAATMFGSTETTFYVLAVYFGSVAVRKTRHALAAGLVADAAGAFAAVFICRVFFS